MPRLRWSCALTFKQVVAFLIIPYRSKSVRSIAFGKGGEFYKFAEQEERQSFFLLATEK